ncbi:MAG: DUF1501 domain-containing protein, partial [Planctomycetota bacterium]
MGIHKTCDGHSRRDFLRVGSLSAAGFTLAGYLERAEAGDVHTNATGKAGIFIDLSGGPSHLDTFDPKPDAPSEIRSKFGTIETNVSGIRVSEHLPKLAQCADKFAILRGVSHTLAAHRLGREYVNTGTKPLPSLEYPGYGAVVTKEFEVNPELPPFVAIPRGEQRAGFLGIQYSPMNTGRSPNAGQPFSVRGITLNNGITVDQIERRHGLLKDIDTTFQSVESSDQLLVGLNRFNQKAFDMITSSKAREAFDISRESPTFAEQFSEDSFSQSCLL